MLMSMQGRMGCCVGVHWDPHKHQAANIKVGDTIEAGDRDVKVSAITSPYDAADTPQITFTATYGTEHLIGTVNNGHLTLATNHGKDWGIKGHIRNAFRARPQKSTEDPLMSYL